VTWHEGILGNVDIVGEKWEKQKSENPSCAANYSDETGTGK
jgi:hypothetical protein